MSAPGCGQMVAGDWRYHRNITMTCRGASTLLGPRLDGGSIIGWPQLPPTPFHDGERMSSPALETTTNAPACCSGSAAPRAAVASRTARTLLFLVAAPMVNEVALVLLFGLFGWRVAALYLATGLAIAILSGFILGRMKLERFVEPWVYASTKAGASYERE